MCQKTCFSNEALKELFYIMIHQSHFLAMWLTPLAMKWCLVKTRLVTGVCNVRLVLVRVPQKHNTDQISRPNKTVKNIRILQVNRIANKHKAQPDMHYSTKDKIQWYLKYQTYQTTQPISNDKSKHTHSGDGSSDASICMIERIGIYHMCAGMRRCALVSGASDVLIEGDVACISML